MGRDGGRSHVPPRPVRPAPPRAVDDELFGCANCESPDGDGVRVRMLKDFAFHVVGTDDEARELDRDHGLGQVAARAGARDRQLADDRRAAARAPRPASRGERADRGAAHRGARRDRRARRPPARPTTSRSSRTGASRPARGRTTSASTSTTCPRSRIASPRSSAAPPGSSSARASARSAGSCATRSGGRTGSSGRTPGAWPSRRTRRARRSRSGSCRAATRPTSGGSARPTSRPPPRRCARSSRGLADSLDGPPYNLVLHTAPLREQVDATYHWHWEIHPRLREIAGLELGTGLPVNPVSPEDAVEELLGRVDAREVRRVERLPSRAPAARHTGGRSVVLGPTSAPRHRRAFRVPSSARSLRGHRPSASPTSATRSTASAARSGRRLAAAR